MPKNCRYLTNIGILKEMGGRYKLTVFASLRQAGWEVENIRAAPGTVNVDKLADNISRARSRVYELAMCNPWDYFCTLTIDPQKLDRYDLDTYRKALTRFLQDYKRNYGCKISWLLIPEQHKDGAWHMHGFLSGIPAVHLIENHHGYLDWPSYTKRFGYISLDAVRDKERCSVYVTKYISKDMGAEGRGLGQHLFYRSRGLEVAKTIKKDLIVLPIRPDFENEYVKVAWFDNIDDALSHFIDDSNTHSVVGQG